MRNYRDDDRSPGIGRGAIVGILAGILAVVVITAVVLLGANADRAKQEEDHQTKLRRARLDLDRLDGEVKLWKSMQELHALSIINSPEQEEELRAKLRAAIQKEQDATREILEIEYQFPELKPARSRQTD